MNKNIGCGAFLWLMLGYFFFALGSFSTYFVFWGWLCLAMIAYRVWLANRTPIAMSDGVGEELKEAADKQVEPRPKVAAKAKKDGPSAWTRIKILYRKFDKPAKSRHAKRRRPRPRS